MICVYLFNINRSIPKLWIPSLSKYGVGWGRGGGGGETMEEVPEYGYFCATIMIDSRKPKSRLFGELIKTDLWCVRKTNLPILQLILV